MTELIEDVLSGMTICAEIVLFHTSVENTHTVRYDTDN
jgi:hypothetical protein